MDIPEHIFKSYDIRGLYPQEINDENIVNIVRAIYAFFSEKRGKTELTVVLGRDMRVSSPSLFEIAKNTLLDVGAHVIDIGLSSTPSFYYAVSSMECDGGLVLSASHNPKEYNGVKIAMKQEQGILKIGKSTGMDEIKRLSLEGVNLEHKEGGKVTEVTDVVEKEVQAALDIAGRPQLKQFKVVADAANAMGATYIKELSKHIPVELIEMNFELDGTFPVHQADPMQAENLKDLQHKVLDEQADLGLAPDGDGDRLFFIDEQGQVVLPSIMLSLVAKELLPKNPGATFITDIKYTFTARKNIEEGGGKLEVTKTGHAFITEAMQKTGAIFAGEASSHFFWRATGGGEAPLPVIILVLEVMTREGKPLSQIAKELKRAQESGEINFSVENAQEVIATLQEHFKDGEVSTLDGVAITYPDRRISLRSSNTEPLIRLNMEAYEQSVLDQTKEEVMKIIDEKAVKTAHVGH